MAPHEAYLVSVSDWLVFGKAESCGLDRAVGKSCRLWYHISINSYTAMVVYEYKTNQK